MMAGYKEMVMAIDGRLKGKVAIITGAASGIGKATAVLFAKEGARLALADIDAAGLKEVANHIAEAGGTAITKKQTCPVKRRLKRLWRML
jgi:NAD(P)-dependent dehydrogenase (short-subunit alcohol dehydrogenase family)